MPLTIGDRLGSYSVTAKIGEGGNRDVMYRARDTKNPRMSEQDQWEMTRNGRLLLCTSRAR